MNDNNNNNNSKKQDYLFSFYLAQRPIPPLILGLDINERDGVSTFSGVSTVLQRFEACSKSLQKIESDLDTVAKTYLFTGRVLLQNFVTDLMILISKRPSCVDRARNINKTIRDVGDAETKQYDEFDNESDDQPRSGRQIIRVDCFNVIISRLSS